MFATERYVTVERRASASLSAPLRRCFLPRDMITPAPLRYAIIDDFDYATPCAAPTLIHATLRDTPLLLLLLLYVDTPFRYAAIDYAMLPLFIAATVMLSVRYMLSAT